MADLFDNPLGTDGFEFVEFTCPDPERLRALFERMGFTAVARHRSKNVLRFTPGRHQLHPEHGADGHAPQFRERARPLGQRHGLPGEGRRQGAAARGRARAPSRSGAGRADGAEHPGDRGHRRHLSTWSTATARRRSTTSTSCRSPAPRRRRRNGAGPDLPRPPHPQRAAATWTTGRTSTSASSTSARSATSTSRASRPACSRRP